MNSAHECRNDPEWEQNEDVRLSPDRIAEVHPSLLLRFFLILSSAPILSLVPR